ncbi:hypothetical protein [Streptomyces sp. 7N604]|uniref:hypothetical protein n=1 Tax=Streptomyces sp. 7N604 TaxID=3457415 RepID=UPI003FD51B75
MTYLFVRSWPVGVTDEPMLSMALHLRDQEMSLRDIANGSSSPQARRRPAPLAFTPITDRSDEARTLQES